MIEGIIFDLGHTLMDFQLDWEEVYQQQRERLRQFFIENNFSLSDEFVDHFIQTRHEGHLTADKINIEYTAEKALLDTFQKFGLNGEHHKVVPAALEAYFSPEVAQWQRYSDSLHVLESLTSSGYRVGLISNASDHPFVLRCVNQLEFERYLDPIISSAAFPVRKPHPDIFTHVAETWKLNPKHIAMVGDQLYYDVYGAHQVGMKGIWVKRDTDKAHCYIPEGMKDHPQMVPEATITELSQILPVLKSLSPLSQ